MTAAPSFPSHVPSIGRSAAGAGWRPRAIDSRRKSEFPAIVRSVAQPSRMDCSGAVDAAVTLMFASWNQIGDWLRRLEALQQAA